MKLSAVVQGPQRREFTKSGWTCSLFMQSLQTGESQNIYGPVSGLEVLVLSFLFCFCGSQKEFFKKKFSWWLAVKVRKFHILKRFFSFSSNTRTCGKSELAFPQDEINFFLKKEKFWLVGQMDPPKWIQIIMDIIFYPHVLCQMTLFFIFYVFLLQPTYLSGLITHLPFVLAKLENSLFQE